MSFNWVVTTLTESETIKNKQDKQENYQEGDLKLLNLLNNKSELYYAPPCNLVNNKSKEEIECINCNLYKELNKALLSQSALGKLCDFWGKIIAIEDSFEPELRRKAYRNMDHEQMLIYAKEIEEEIKNIDPLMERDDDTIRKLVGAVHWLRTCAKYGLNMVVFQEFL